MVRKMVIKYCPSCSGQPYTKNVSASCCPICGAELKTAISDESELVFRDTLPDDNNNNSDFFENEGDAFTPEDTMPPYFSDSSSNVPEVYDQDENSNPSGDLTLPDYSKNNEPIMPSISSSSNTITGIVSNYSCDESYHRYIPVKLFDALIYRQRFSDRCHRFTVRVNSGTDSFGSTCYADIPVNMYGVISQGINIANNQVVQVSGKYKSGVLLASDLRILTNSSSTKIRMQHSAKAILYSFLAIAALLFTVYIATSSGESLLQTTGTIFKTWLIIFVVLTVLYFVVLFSRIGRLRMAFRGNRKFPFIGILLVSLILTLILTAGGGLANSIGGLLSGLLSSVITIAIVIAIIIFIFKK